MKKYLKYTAILMILSVFIMLAVSSMAGAILPASEQFHKPKIREGTTSGGSSNWAGYALDSPVGSVSDVKGSWIVPPVTCPSTPSQYSSFWVGIDGDNSNTVEQTGTDSDCSTGTPNYYAWFEFYPQPGYYAPITVHAGDNISAEVKYTNSGRFFTVIITDQTTGKSFSTSAKVGGARRNSAEWITEAPWSNGVLPLANFGTAYFGPDYTGISGTNIATVNGVTGNIGSFASSRTVNVNTITMLTSSGVVKAQPSSPLSIDGTSFSVAWKNAGP